MTRPNDIDVTGRISQNNDVFFFICFSYFFIAGISKSLGVATRPTLSGRLQPAGDHDPCPAARRSVDTVRNQAESQWRTEGRGKGNQKEGYVSNKNCLNVIYCFFPSRTSPQNWWRPHHLEDNPREWILKGGPDGPIRGVPVLTNLNRVSFE